MTAPAKVMTLADLRRAAELLPAGASIALPREALLAALEESIVSVAAPTTALIGEEDQSLTAEEVAQRLQVSTRWVYDHGEQLGARHLSRRCVRYSARAVTRYLARRS